MVSHLTSSTGSPRIAPITSYSHMPLGTGEPAQKPSDGSQPIATAIGISFLPRALPGGDMVADMLRAPHQDRDLVAAADHAAIDADIHHAGLGSLVTTPP